MTTIDSLLHFVFLEAMTTTPPFSSRDNKTLRSLHTAMQSTTYITEKQGTLLLAILSNQLYTPFMLLANADYKEYLDNPQWQHPFRVLPDVKKIYHIPAGSTAIPEYNGLRDNYTGVIAIEFTFSSTIRNHLKPLSSVIHQVRSGSFYIADYTEQNLYTVMKNLEQYNFEVSPELQAVYNTIITWDNANIASQFLLENINFPMFKHAIDNDLGDNIDLNDLLIKDRKHRYQYTNHVACNNNTLTETIANRTKTKIWIDSNTHTLSNVVKSLVELKRLPMLVVFDQTTPLITITQFNELSTALTKNGITDNIGIYFRLDNTPDGKIFNDGIANRKYNSMLDDSTAVAGVLGGKLPKFFLKTGWKPMSVLCIKNTLRQSKTAVYATCSDLIITYTPTEPIIETRNIWELN
jgi:hypothetical protein